MNALAQATSEAVKDKALPTQYLSFFIGADEYGIGILRVREIIEFTGVTRVPTTPPWIRGVINLRGQVVPVVDLAVKFGLPETVATKWTCVVIVEVQIEGDATVMGIMVDSVSQVLEFGSGDIEPPPAFGTRVKVDFLIGMGKIEANKFVLLLDIDRVLSLYELLLASNLREVAAEYATREVSTTAEAKSAEAAPKEAGKADSAGGKKGKKA